MTSQPHTSWFLHRGPRQAIGRRTSLALAFGVIVIMVTLTVPSSGAQDIVSELQAEFIGRFPQFIEWPADSAVADATKPFVIGVYGDSLLLPALQKVASRTRIKGKPVETRRINSVNELGTCQIIFLARSKRAQLPDVLGQTKGKPIGTGTAA